MTATPLLTRLPRRLEKLFCLFANESRAYNQKEICRILKLPKYTVSRYVKKLRDKGLLQEEKHGVVKNYSRTEAGVQYSRFYFTGGSQAGGRSVRSHKFQFNAHIVHKPRSWVLDNSWRVVPVRNWRKYIGDGFEGLRVEITPKRVIFYVHEIFSSSPDEGCLIAVKLVEKAMVQLYNDFPELVLGKPYRAVTLVGQHHAFLEDDFAVRTPKGFSVDTGRVAVDASRGVKELEFPHLKFSQDDSMRYVEFVDKFVRGGYDFEALNRLGGLDVVLGRLAVAVEKSVEAQSRVLEVQNRILEVQSILLERVGVENGGKPSFRGGFGFESLFNGT